MLGGEGGDGTVGEHFKRRQESPESRRFGAQLSEKLAAAVAREGSAKPPITHLGESWATALNLPARELLLGLYSAHGDRTIFTTDVAMNGSGEAADALFRDVLLDGMDPALFRAAPRQTALAELAAFKAPAFDKLLGAGDQERLDVWWNEAEEPRSDEGALALLLDPAASPLPHVAAAYRAAVAQQKRQLELLATVELSLAGDYLTWIDLQRAQNRNYQFPFRQAPEMELAIDPVAEAARRRDETLRLAAEGLKATDMTAFLKGLRPAALDYAPLQQAVGRYLDYAVRDAWQPLTGRQVLSKKSTGAQVVALRARLAAEGFEAGEAGNATFDTALRRALQSYQRLRQLAPTGKLDELTRASLNQTPVRRLAQLGVALDRWRLSRAAADFGKQHIFINIAGFEATLQDKGAEVYRWRTVVGKWVDRVNKDGKRVQKGLSPLFSDTLEYVVFNPYWNVPDGIRAAEYQAKIDADPTWLETHQYEIYKAPDGIEWLRQLPGPDNLLGAVKFLFPNDHNVYMHDTPARGLFDQPIRAYSHGCVRVQEPMKLAALLLKRDREWSEKRVEKFIEEQVELATEQWIGLRQKIPVHLEYEGVGVSEKGEIAFFGDIYRLDRDALATKETVFAAAIAAARAKGAGAPEAVGSGSGDGSGGGDGSGSGR
jgi:murein L,D-transpeptidase YcbB/YkuD